MKLLLIGLDGLRIDLALPEEVAADPRFAVPDHPADPRFARSIPPADAQGAPAPAPGVAAPTLRRLAASGTLVPVWMTPPTDSAAGWSSLLTGTTHEQNNVWWNEFVGHRLARCPDILSRVFFADPSARTFAASTWAALVDPSGPGPVIHQRIDQQVGGQHQILRATDFSEGCRSADRQVGTRAAWVLNHEGPDAAFVYFEGVDEAGHAHGATSAQYRQAIADVDEHVRSLVKAVSERHEQLGEEWLIAVTTDHGHKPEGGHGEDEVEVRRSFLLLHAVGGRALDVRETSLKSHEVTPLLLRLLGVRDGVWHTTHEVGVARDVASIGPSRVALHEW